MAGGASSKCNPPRPRKRVDADTNSTLKRARDGSAFTRCHECNKDVAVALIDMHNCSLDSRIKMHLESHVVEKASEPKKPVQRKRPAAATEKSEKKGKKSKKGEKDPNMPKRPPTPFFLFMAEYRDQFKEANPDSKKASAAAKEGGEKWKSMTDEEKKPYLDKFAELKAEYEKAMEEYKAARDDEVQEIEGPDSGKEEEDVKEEEDTKEEEDAKEEDDVKEECDKELEDDLKVDDDAEAPVDIKKRGRLVKKVVKRVLKRVVSDDEDE